MSLSSYSRAAYNIGEELRALLRDEAYGPFLASLSASSALTVCEFRRDNVELVRKVATAQPKPRLKHLDKLPVEARFWTIAAAAQMAFEASAVIDAAEIHLRTGGSYRSMIAEAEQVLLAPHSREEVDWPFPTPSPFPHPDDAEDDE
ncbi:MAG: hypothetical protein A2092_12065 [Rhodobacteraceae bacterium GWE1_64_9]|nr:MAG: hypothetical protein A2092_12065 [Rhodobacteraceae bacterium GWE1_64_9]HBD91783.1 hypothetical protein [Gemmobacter sp.]